jgi:two-component system OmpR family response regulator
MVTEEFAVASPSAEGVARQVESTDRTVLVVDDDTNVRGLIERWLRRIGYQVLTAADAATARAQIRSCAIDLVIMDLSLPDMDGFAFLEQLKSDPATEALPALIVSAYSDVDWQVRSVASGAAGFLGKPFHGRDLIAAVESILATGSCCAVE